MVSSPPFLGRTDALRYTTIAILVQFSMGTGFVLLAAKIELPGFLIVGLSVLAYHLMLVPRAYRYWEMPSAWSWRRAEAEMRVIAPSMVAAGLRELDCPTWLSWLPVGWTAVGTIVGLLVRVAG